MFFYKSIFIYVLFFITGSVFAGDNSNTYKKEHYRLISSKTKSRSSNSLRVKGSNPRVLVVTKEKKATNKNNKGTTNTKSRVKDKTKTDTTTKTTNTSTSNNVNTNTSSTKETTTTDNNINKGSSIYNIQSKLKKIEFLEIDFIQKIYTPLRNKTRVIEGKAFFAYPNKFKWIRTKPIKEQIIYDGSHLSIYKPDEKTAVVFDSISVQNQEVENITDMILDTSTLLDKYKVIESSLDDKIVFLKLYPKEEGTNISEINLTVDLSKNYVDTLKIYYIDKKTWEFDFSNPKTKALSASFFKFKAPAGVSVSKE